MMVDSVNVGSKTEILYRGRTVLTGIFKSPVNHSVLVNNRGLSGDEQADLTVHGGVDQAVYAYSSIHYNYWKDLLKTDTLPFGSFGENINITGYTEAEVASGDIFEVGSCQLQVTFPRQPCSKLNAKFDNNQMVKLFNKSGRSGFYLRVIKEGKIKAGDKFTKIKSPGNPLFINEFYALLTEDKLNKTGLLKAIKADFVPQKYRQRFQDHYNALNA